jgi:hypothetical protein
MGQSYGANDGVKCGANRGAGGKMLPAFRISISMSLLLGRFPPSCADTGPVGSNLEPLPDAEKVMSEQHRSTTINAEVLAVTGGIEEATDQPVVCLTLRPITGSGWGHINYVLGIENAHSLLDRLNRVLNPSEFDSRGEDGPPS